MFASNVQPPKRPLREKPRDWFCDCPIPHPDLSGLKPGATVTMYDPSIKPGHLARCPDCGMERP